MESVETLQQIITGANSGSDVMQGSHHILLWRYNLEMISETNDGVMRVEPPFQELKVIQVSREWNGIQLPSKALCLIFNRCQYFKWIDEGSD